ncbi:MAG: DUF507 family protein [Candidatus Acidiferrales bacterium]
MRLQREYVDYVVRVLLERLISAEMIQTANPQPISEKLRQVLLDELAVEDRINDRVREYMNQYADEIRRSGVSYQDMFKRIKSELVRREKVIL